MSLPSLSNLITDIENAIQTTEADVESWVVQIQSGLAVLDTDLSAGLKWVASVAPGWVTALQTVVAIAGAIPGLNIPAAAITIPTTKSGAFRPEQGPGHPRSRSGSGGRVH